MRTRVVAASLAVFLTVFALAQVPANLTAKTTIAQKSEPGERLLVSGTLYDSVGKTPQPNVILYAYQTDATGVYSKPVDDSRNPRLKGWVKTDAQGRFELDTIKPGSYPGGGNPAHIHVVIMDKGREAGHDECWFEGDRYLRDSQKQREQAAGRFSRIVRLTKGADGVLRGEWNLRLR